jgi:hypothetical protein
VIGGKQNSGAGNVDRLSVTGILGAFAQNAIPNLALDRKAIRMAPVCVTRLFSAHFYPHLVVSGR